jgi:hypothetical protein
VDRAERQRGVRLAREEMQGALEWPLMLNGRADLETATAEIVDVALGGDCELCDRNHRNGDCSFRQADWTGEGAA